MLADPFGNRLIAGASPKPGQDRVEFLVEVSDPSEAIEFGYSVNGIQLSDFYTPHFFDPVQGSGVRYSFTGAITKPRQVLKGGYLSWHDPLTDHWFQETFFSGSKPTFVDLGKLSASNGSFRSQIDGLSNAQSLKTMMKKRGTKAKTLSLTAAASAAAVGNSPFNRTTESKAGKLRLVIQSIVRAK